jgi:hypothetical protein
MAGKIPYGIAHRYIKGITHRFLMNSQKRLQHIHPVKEKTEKKFKKSPFFFLEYGVP